ncbi:MAG TPA: alpha/beta hydrolase, partial [Alphaproteobacteria bacterium]|nr:alpha/beta hydrolase [Alphaproteobacteria bacterium]
MSDPFFPGFAHRRIAAGEAEIDLVTGGAGPPLLLLHGYPQTRADWHRVAPALAARFTLVLPDLPGYGDSRGPAPDPENRAYSKRAMAAAMVAVMAALGHGRFAVAGHDRGGRVAYRMALDHPDRVSRLAVLDIIPTVEMWDRIDRKRALSAYHWAFLAQTAPLPERMIAADPDFYLDWTLDSWLADKSAIDPAAREAYRRAFRRPEVIAAACADYRAGATVDAETDAADRAAGRRIACPLLMLWGEVGIDPAKADWLDVWRGWADDVR